MMRRFTIIPLLLVALAGCVQKLVNEPAARMDPPPAAGSPAKSQGKGDTETLPLLPTTPNK
jgi:hypothetical protein